MNFLINATKQGLYIPLTGQIDRIYAFKESLPENHRFIAENGKTTLAQGFTDVRYKKADNEFMSNNLKNTLKKQGFDK